MRAYRSSFQGIAPTLIAVRVGREAELPIDNFTSRTRYRSRALSHLNFRRSAQRSGNFDIGDNVGGSGDSPTDSSIGHENRGGQSEKLTVQRSDTPL